jgi:hypothetical protein
VNKIKYKHVFIPSRELLPKLACWLKPDKRKLTETITLAASKSAKIP